MWKMKGTDLFFCEIPTFDYANNQESEDHLIVSWPHLPKLVVD